MRGDLRVIGLAVAMAGASLSVGVAAVVVCLQQQNDAIDRHALAIQCTGEPMEADDAGD